jgi:hypothetical protein
MSIVVAPPRGWPSPFGANENVVGGGPHTNTAPIKTYDATRAARIGGFTLVEPRRSTRSNACYSSVVTRKNEAQMLRRFVSIDEKPSPSMTPAE